MRLTPWLAAAGYLILGVAPTAAQPLGARAAAQVDSAVMAELRSTRAPGMVLVIVRGDSVVHRKAYGVADAETKAQMSVDMMLSVASVSKVVTAVAAVTLAREGKLALDAPIAMYLPWIAAELGSLTMNQLMSHTAGLGELTPGVALGPGGSLAPVCRAMTSAAIVAPAGATWGYTNTGYTIAGCVIEAVAKASFSQAVAQAVFRPLGMTRSTYSPLVAMTYPHAQGHDTRRDTTIIVRPYNSSPAITPAGELITTVDDLTRLARTLLADGQLHGVAVLPRGILSDLIEIRGHGGAFVDAPRDYGLGMFIRTYRGLHIAEHEGVYAGFGASFVLAPERGIAVIGLSNGRYSPPVRTTQAAVEIAAGMSPLPLVQRTIPLSAADSAAAIGRYAAIGDTLAINTVGGKIVLQRGARSQAIAPRTRNLWALPGYPALLPMPETPFELDYSMEHGHVEFVRLGWRVYRRVEQ